MYRAKNKKALSEIVGYTLLIVIALGMAAGVYSFLKVYIPKEKPDCGEDIRLTIEDYSCTASGNVMVTIRNSGLFRADAAFIRLGPQNAKIKTQLNMGEDIYLSQPDSNTTGLDPGRSFSKEYPVSSVTKGISGPYVLEVQPAVVKNRVLTLCEKAIISQTIECS